MKCRQVHLLDLPDEILLLILRKLDNMDVLYSLSNSDNQRLDMTAQDHTFTNNLNFTSISSNEDVCSVSDAMLDRFCVNILPTIHQYVKSLILESSSMERILRAANYLNLTELKIFNFNPKIFSEYFTEDVLFRHIHQELLVDLTLIGSEKEKTTNFHGYSMNVYANILIFFNNLKHLTIMSSSTDNFSNLSLDGLPPTTFSSSKLTKLCVTVSDFDTCLALLDGRFKKLTSFIVQVDFISNRLWTSSNNPDLPDLKCCSFICYHSTRQFDNQIVPLLRRMPSLEELSLYLSICNRPTFIDGNYLQNAILTHMSRLHAFTFCIDTQIKNNDSTLRLSDDDIQRTFTNIGIQQVVCIANYHSTMAGCHVFSLPFKFDRLDHITNNLPNLVLNYVTHLTLSDGNAFKHAFFVRITHSFPSLKYLTVFNLKPPFWIFVVNPPPVHDNWCSIVEYPHLISLDIRTVNIHYVEHFLNHTKTVLPRLSELKIASSQLKTVTENFTRDATRNNCANVNQLILEGSTVHLEHIRHYFPLLSMASRSDII